MANVSEFVIERFHPLLGDVMAHGHTHYWLHGGRGSTKSSFISICIVLLIIANPKANAVVVRRFGNTLRDSDSRIRTFQRIRNGADWGWFPDPWRFVRCAWEPDARRLLIFEEHSANKTMPADTGRVVVDALTFSDEPGGEAYYHDQIVNCDDAGFQGSDERLAARARDSGPRCPQGPDETAFL